MTLIHTDGIETYMDTLEATLKCAVGSWSRVGNATLNTSGPRTGAQHLQVDGGSQQWRYTYPSTDEHATLIFGHAYWHNIAEDHDAIRFMSDAGATTHIIIRVTAAWGLEIRRGDGTVLAASAAGVLAASTWFYIEGKCTLADAGGYVEVRLNGSVTPILTYTGDTKNGGTKTVLEAIQVGTAGSFTSRFDDFYFLNGAGSAPYNDFLGEVRCYPLAPNGNGNSSQLTGSDGDSVNNYLHVDEIPSASNDADYVGSATVDQQDTYAHSDLTITAGTVLDVKVSQRAYKSDAATRGFASIVRSGGSDVATADRALGTGAQRWIDRYAVNPVTANPWTLAEINALEAGFRVRP